MWEDESIGEHVRWRVEGLLTSEVVQIDAPAYWIRDHGAVSADVNVLQSAKVVEYPFPERSAGEAPLLVDAEGGDSVLECRAEVAEAKSVLEVLRDGHAGPRHVHVFRLERQVDFLTLLVEADPLGLAVAAEPVFLDVQLAGDPPALVIVVVADECGLS